MVKPRAKKHIRSADAVALRALRTWVASSTGRACIERASHAASKERKHLAEAVSVPAELLRARVTF
jgi:hypothetical protein